MKIKMLLVGIVSLASVNLCYAEMLCDETKYESTYDKKFPIVDSEEFIVSKTALFPNGKLTCIVDFDYRTRKGNKRTRVEEGVLDGAKYRIYFSDGSGRIQGLATNKLDILERDNWDLECKQDKVDDTHWCSLSKGDLSVAIWKDRSNIVLVGSKNYPGSQMVVRIDKDSPISTDSKTGFNAQQSKKIIDDMKKAKSVLTRYQEWPSQSNKDTVIDAFGFLQAWEIIQKEFNSSH